MHLTRTHARTDAQTTDARTWRRFFCHSSATFQGSQWKNERKTTAVGQGQAEGGWEAWWAAMLAIFHAFNNRNDDAPLSWASIHLFIHSPARSLARSFMRSGIHSFTQALTEPGGRTSCAYRVPVGGPVTKVECIDCVRHVCVAMSYRYISTCLSVCWRSFNLYWFLFSLNKSIAENKTINKLEMCE